MHALFTCCIPVDSRGQALSDSGGAAVARTFQAVLVCSGGGELAGDGAPCVRVRCQ